MITKKIILPALAIAVMGGTTIWATNHAYAQSETDTIAGLAQKISQKFNLDQSQVKSVIDEYHQGRKQERLKQFQQNQEDRLNKLVQDGKITQEQKQAILDEFAALKNKYSPQSLKDLTPQQRKEKMQAMKDEIKSWADAQKIDLSLLKPAIGMGGMKMMHMMGK
jgi:hypothetical protein